MTYQTPQFQLRNISIHFHFLSINKCGANQLESPCEHFWSKNSSSSLSGNLGQLANAELSPTVKRNVEKISEMFKIQQAVILKQTLCCLLFKQRLDSSSPHICFPFIIRATKYILFLFCSISIATENILIFNNSSPLSPTA